MNANTNTSRSTGLSLRQAAIIAGLGLLLMAVLAPIAQFGILQKLVVSGDATATANNILAATGLYRSSIGLFLVVAILDVVVAWALYVVLRPANSSLSLLTAWFRLVYAAVFVSALSNLVIALQFVDGSSALNGLDANQLHAQVMVSLNAFTDGWNMALIVFGRHLLLLGYLAFRSGYVPKWLGGLVVLAGLGYLVDNVGKLLSANYGLTISMFTFIGEVVLIFWLLWKGARGFGKELEAE